MNWLKRVYFKIMSCLCWLVARGTGWIHAPWTHKITSYEDVLRLYGTIKVGDIILTRTRGEMSTLTIPGQWKHSAIYIGDKKILHAISPCVTKAYLADLIMKTDYFAVMRMKDMTEEEGKAIAGYALKYLGRDYDFGLQIWDEDEMYCSEIVFHSVNSVRENYIELRYRMGYPTFTPNDNYKARKKFDLITELR